MITWLTGEIEYFTIRPINFYVALVAGSTAKYSRGDASRYRDTQRTQPTGLEITGAESHNSSTVTDATISSESTMFLS